MTDLDSLTDVELIRYATWDKTPLVRALAERLERQMHPPEEIDVDAYLTKHTGLGVHALAALFPGEAMHSLVAALWGARRGTQLELF